MADKIKIDKKSYEKCVAKLKELKKELKDLSAGTSESAKADPKGRNSSQFISHEQAVDGLVSNIMLLNEMISRFEIIEKKDLADHIVNIGDKVVVRFDEDDEEEFKLIAGLPSVARNEVSINSPIGSAVFMKEVGSEINYMVGKNTFYATIVSTEKETQDNRER